MESSLNGKTAIVTGASKGIGRAIASKLGRLGAFVTVGYLDDEEGARTVVAEIEAGGGAGMAIRVDMRSVADIERLFDRTIANRGGVDILVNNAGRAVFKPVADTTEEEFDALFAINVKGVFFACRQAALKMARGGKIVNISSSVTRMMLPDYGLYAATKGAVDQVTKVLAKELGAKGIAVNAISPGPVDTALFRQGKTEERIRMLAEMAAFGRLGQPEDIADAVALLVSDAAGWVSGQNLCVNGGFVA
jgi:3-oxoacyl-[acyl-carrier protein] reductase